MKLMKVACSACQKGAERSECMYTTKRMSGVGSSATVPSDEPVFRRELNNGNGVKRQRLISPTGMGPLSSVAGHNAPLPHGVRDEVSSASLMDTENQPAEPHSVDSMNGVTGGPEETREIFGSSSAGSFMRQIQAAIDAKQSSTNLPTRRDISRDMEHFPEDNPLSIHEEAALFALPSRGLADSLIKAYWDFEWSLYPIVNRRNIETVYESLWAPQRSSCSLISMSIINLCFALGCHYCELLPPQERKSTSKTFFSRAELLHARLPCVLSLERVQLLLLFGIYLQSTNHVFRLWMTVGEAIRMGQSLGIYQQPDDYSESVSYREIKRRTWHGCIWLDR